MKPALNSGSGVESQLSLLTRLLACKHSVYLVGLLGLLTQSGQVRLFCVSLVETTCKYGCEGLLLMSLPYDAVKVD